MSIALNELPVFIRRVIYCDKFSKNCTTYNNLLAIAVTKVCNYCETLVLLIEVQVMQVLH